jgi:hypothetical protein
VSLNMESTWPVAALAQMAAAHHGRTFYQVKVAHETMCIDKRYQQLSYIGGGAYGFVCAATDSVSLYVATRPTPVTLGAILEPVVCGL